jgi:hypothetical protein
MAANVKKTTAIIFIFIVFSQEKDSFIPSPCDTALGFSLQPILFRLGADESQWALHCNHAPPFCRLSLPSRPAGLTRTGVCCTPHRRHSLTKLTLCEDSQRRNHLQTNKNVF